MAKAGEWFVVGVGVRRCFAVLCCSRIEFGRRALVGEICRVRVVERFCSAKTPPPFGVGTAARRQLAERCVCF